MSPNEDKLTRLHERIRQCIECPLHRSRRQAVPGEGNPGAQILFVGEAPGKTEDEQGRPFVGPAGKFLDRLLKDHDLTRENVFLTSSVKCRPPNNRAPHPIELEICKGLWLDRQIELIDPTIVVLLGQVSIAQVLNEPINLKESHGQMLERNGRWYQIQYHPAAGRRFPDIRSSMRHDMKRLKRFLETPS
jgi:uracil-DNA glycosylase family 4